MLSGIVIGAGSAGQRHWKILGRLNDEICRFQISSRDFDEQIERRFFGGLMPCLDQFDFAVVASPASRHFDHIAALANYGIPMLVEKPLAMDSREAAEIEAVFPESHSLIQVGYVMRYSDSFRFFMEQILARNSTKLRKVTIVSSSYFPNWRPGLPYELAVSGRALLGGGVLRELSHELDYLLSLVREVHVSFAKITGSNQLKADVETACEMFGTGPDGEQILVSLNMASLREERWCRAEFGSGESVTWNALENTVSTEREGVRIACVKFNDSRDCWYRAQMEDFMAVVRRERDPAPSMEHAFRVMKLIDEIRQQTDTI